MAFPDGIDTVECTVPVAFSSFDGEAVQLHADLEIISSTRSIIWNETGQEMTQLIEKTYTDAGDIVFTTPVCDQEGWRDSAGFLNPKWSVMVTVWYSENGKDGPRTFHWFRPLEADVVDGINIGMLPDDSVPVEGSTDYDTFWEEETTDRKAADAALESGKIEGFNGVHGLWAGTQSEYDALVSKDPATVYLVA